MLAICDAYDAMVSDRVYRKGRPPEQAMVELRRCAGTQFDPELVERFIAVQTQSPPPAPAQPVPGPGEKLQSLGTRLHERQEQVLVAVSREVQELAALVTSAKRAPLTPPAPKPLAK